MSTPKQRETAPAAESESEDTAKLPVLPDRGEIPDHDALSNTDSWSMTDVRKVDVTATHPTIANDAEIGALRSDLASMAESRGHLEGNLHALTSNLRDLESRLLAKSEQLSSFEREVGLRDRHILELEREAGERDALLAAAHADSRQLQQLLEQQRAEHAAIEDARRGEAESRSQAVRARDTSEAALAYTKVQVSSLQLQTRQQHELLQSMESRRQYFEAMLDEREQKVSEQQSIVANLQSQLAGTQQDAGQREQSLQSTVDEQRARIHELEQQLGSAQARVAALEAAAAEARNSGNAERSAAADRLQQLQQSMEATARDSAVQLAELNTRYSLAQTRAAELSASLGVLQSEHTLLREQHGGANQTISAQKQEQQEQVEALRALQEQLKEVSQRADQHAADLAAAEERIRDSDGELRQREHKLEKLAGVENELRAQLRHSQHSLQERNALIARLENETASSAAVLGSIQRNLEHLGSEAVTVPPAEQSARLLVRAEQGTEIVHVLGRKTVIGRGPECELRVDAEFVSRRHAVILVSASSTVIEDLDSTNGIQVNGTRVTRRVLSDGDEVVVGRTAFRYLVKPVSGGSPGV
jgi:chromosome segregation ATPase